MTNYPEDSATGSEQTGNIEQNGVLLYLRGITITSAKPAYTFINFLTSHTEIQSIESLAEFIQQPKNIIDLLAVRAVGPVTIQALLDKLHQDNYINEKEKKVVEILVLVANKECTSLDEAKETIIKKYGNDVGVDLYTEQLNELCGLVREHRDEGKTQLERFLKSILFNNQGLPNTLIRRITNITSMETIQQLVDFLQAKQENIDNLMDIRQVGPVAMIALLKSLKVGRYINEEGLTAIIKGILTFYKNHRGKSRPKFEFIDLLRENAKEMNIDMGKILENSNLGEG